MNRFYKDRGYSRKPAFGSKRGFRSGGRKSSRKGKYIAALVLVLGIAALFQFEVLSFASIKGGVAQVGSSAKNAYQQSTAWISEKVGFKDSEFLLPVSSGVVVEDYGVVQNEKGEECYHGGVDIKVPQGSEVLAAEGGEISAVDTHEDETLWITIKHSGSWSTVYGRLGTANVAVGDRVEKGAVLGTPQKETLHFEVLENGTQKDPVDYFQSNS